MFKNVQTIFEYNIQSWSEKEISILNLSDLARKVGNTEEKDGIWFFALSLADMIENEKKHPNEFVFFDFNKAVIKLLDSDLINSFIKLYSEIVNILLIKEQENKNNLNRQNLNNLEIRKINSLYLSFTEKNKWLTILNNISSEEWNNINEKITKLVEYDEILYYQLTHIGSVIGLNSVYDLYSLEEIKDIFSTKKEKYSLIRLLRSLSEYMRDENGYNLSLFFTNLLNTQFYFEKDTYSWDDMIILIMMLHIVFNKFERLTDEKQIMLTQYYLFRAFLLGVDVRKKIQNVLYDTNFVIDYVVASMDFYQALNNNQERIIVDTANFTTKSLNELFKNYLATSGTSFFDGYKVKNFLDNLYSGQKYRDFFVGWLQEIFYIFLHLKNGSLIEKNKGNELTKDEIYQNDMVMLMVNFMIGIDGADFIVNYFSKKENIVPLLAFIKKLIDLTDLKEEIIINNFLILTDILRKNHLLPEDQEIIFFNEQTGGFEFNKDLRV